MLLEIRFLKKSTFFRDKEGSIEKRAAEFQVEIEKSLKVANRNEYHAEKEKSGKEDDDRFPSGRARRPTRALGELVQVCAGREFAVHEIVDGANVEE